MPRIIDMIFGETKSVKRKSGSALTYHNIVEVIIVYTKEGRTQAILRDANYNDIEIGHIEYWTIEDWTKVKKIYGGDDMVTDEAGVTMIFARNDAPFTVVYENPGRCEVEFSPFVVEAIKLTIK
jgi:hypothetical protein